MMLGSFKTLLMLCGYPQRFRSPLVLAQSAVPASVTGAVAETVLATITIPAGAMSANGRLRIKTLFAATLNATNADVFRVRLGGTALVSSGSVTNVVMYTIGSDINNAGATNSQVASASATGGGGSAPSTSTVDMTQTQSLTITAQLGLATDTITLRSYTVELLNP